MGSWASGVMAGPRCVLSQTVMSLCDLVDHSLRGSSVHGISQARIFVLFFLLHLFLLVGG